VVFVGINPGRVSDAARAHFANPRNDFWRLLHAAKFTSRLYAPEEQFEVLREGIGITNAAYRTTPGSGDLRKADFDGGRLERMALELKPAWLGFVGKEAYRGAFGERPDLGVQQRRIGDTQLFVLPSTSPANAAVPWFERARWFFDLAARVHGNGPRHAVRAVVLDRDDRVLLAQADDELGVWWTLPGGGIDEGEDDVAALHRELHEEVGLRGAELGPLIWTREHRLVNPRRFGCQRERIYLIRTDAFDAAPAFTKAELAAQDTHDARWFTLDELETLTTGPPRLAQLVRDLLEQGPPAEPIALDA
jgi:TDG/mug DNA glycosylase family protein